MFVVPQRSLHEIIVWNLAVFTQYWQEKWRALTHAAHSGKLEVVKFLLHKGADPTVKDGIWKDEENLKKLKISPTTRRPIKWKDEKKNVSSPFTESYLKRRKEGGTPLHWAALAGHVEVIKALVDAGAPQDACDAQGLNPMTLAARNGKVEAVRFLLLCGCKVNDKYKGVASIDKVVKKAQLLNRIWLKQSRSDLKRNVLSRFIQSSKSKSASKMMKAAKASGK